MHNGVRIIICGFPLIFVVLDCYKQLLEMKDVIHSPTLASKLSNHKALKAVSSTPILSKSNPSNPSQDAYKRILEGELLSPIFPAAGIILAACFVFIHILYVQ